VTETCSSLDPLQVFYQEALRRAAKGKDELPLVNAPEKLTITLNAEGSHPAH
jgi:hypothetical protein